MRSIVALSFLLLPLFSKGDTITIHGNGNTIQVADTFLTNSILKEKDPTTALALCVLLGPLGVHRIYLGTSKTTAIAYILTGAGFGVLWVTDTVLIIKALIRKDPESISSNRHFFLWNR